MNWLDVVLGAFVILAALAGLVQGLIKTLLPLIGLMAGVVVAGNYYKSLADHISNSTAGHVAAFAIIVLIFLIAFWVLAMVLHGLLKLMFLGWIDHLAGFVLGAVLGFIIAGAVLDVLLVNDTGTSTIAQSGVANLMAKKIPLALAFLPGSFDRVKDIYFH